jgi:hypothetical protein
MEKGYLRNPGKMIPAALALALLLLPAEVRALETETTITPQRVGVGESATLRIKVSGGGEVEPVKVPRVDGLEIEFSGTQRSFEYINGKSFSGTVLNFSVVPLKSGSFTVPAFEMRLGGRPLRSKPVQLIAVRTAVSGMHSSAQPRAILTVSKKRVYAGEPVIIRYFLLHGGLDMSERPALEKLPDTRGFVQKQLDESIADSVVQNGTGDYVSTHIATFAVIPAEKGVFTIGSASFIVRAATQEGFFSFPRNFRAVCGEETIEVLPLPEGKPRGFSGDVGKFTVTAAYDGGQVNVFEEKRISVKVRGTGNFISLSRPVLVAGPGMKVISEEGKSAFRPGSDTLEGEREFIFTVIPEKGGEIVVPGPRLVFFNPLSGGYQTAAAGEVRFEAKGGVPAKEGIGFDEEPKKPGNANIFIIIAAIAGIIVIIMLVVLWERRRYRMVTGSSGEKTAAGEPSMPETGQYESELHAALRRGDGAAFLKAAEKLINVLESDAGLAEDARVQSVKSAVYGFRYAGGAITAEEMNGLSRELLKLNRDAGRRR